MPITTTHVPQRIDQDLYPSLEDLKRRFHWRPDDRLHIKGSKLKPQHEEAAAILLSLCFNGKKWRSIGEKELKAYCERKGFLKNLDQIQVCLDALVSVRLVRLTIVGEEKHYILMNYFVKMLLEANVIDRM